MAQRAKCLTRKINHLRKKRATGRSSSYEKRKKEYKDKVRGENAHGKLSRNWSNIYDEPFNRVLFPQKLHHRFLTGS